MRLITNDGAELSVPEPLEHYMLGVLQTKHAVEINHQSVIKIIMKIFKKIIAAASIALGIFFILNTVSDIQMGFGCVLILQGLLGL